MNGLAARHQKSPTSLLLFEANTKPNQHHQGFAHLERILHSRAVQRLRYSWQLYIVFSKVHGNIIVVIFFLHTSFPALLVLLKGRSTSFVHCAKWPSLGSPPTGLSLSIYHHGSTIICYSSLNGLLFSEGKMTLMKTTQTITIPVLDLYR